MNLQEIIDYIEDIYVFSEEKFPKTATMTEKEKLAFAINHLVLHSAKTTGKIAGDLEPTQHGNRLDADELKNNLAKSLINTLRLASLVEMKGVELEGLIKKFVK